MENGFIHIKNARVNNLKGVDIDIPRNKFVVITGISGSGKSSLAFDTLFAEGQRRFAQSLSSFARQFLGRMTKPDVESITGIPPAIAVEQKVSTRNPRSTVGSVTQIYDYLRLLFAKAGKTYSPLSGKQVKCDNPESVIAESIRYASSEEFAGDVMVILSDIGWQKCESKVELLLKLKEEGFSRLAMVTPDGRMSVLRIDRVMQGLDTYADSDILLLIDRYSSGEFAQNDTATLSSARDSLTTAFDKGRGYVRILFVNDNMEVKRDDRYSSFFEADGLFFEEPQEWLFNYNSPLGACPVCGGFGKTEGIDESLVIPNQALSVYQDAIACWKGEVMKHFKEEVILNAEYFDFPIHTPYKELTDEQKSELWQGNSYITGIIPFFKELEKKRYKIQNRYMISRYTGRAHCFECNGSRLRKESLYVKVGGKNIDELMSMSIKELISFFDTLKLSAHEEQICRRCLGEIRQRLSYIDNVGLSYLTLKRASNTLSGGESQRINLVNSLGNSLTGSMYILDEPSIGLHDRDTKRLIGVIKSLRDLGNSVIVVEHDEEIIRSADYLVDIGPLAGSHGGEVVYCGATPAEDISDTERNRLLEEYPKSLTLKYLLGEKQLLTPASKRVWRDYIEIKEACENNLKHIDVKFPLNVLTVVTGVSGSGKSTLVGDILYPALNRHFKQTGPNPGSYMAMTGALSKISGVEFVDQNPIGKSSRSNPVTYIKAYDEIRKLFSEQPYAKMNGFGHSHFSFNIDGGRCPECLGEGVIKISMQFMADITMTCESCGGKRFKPEILQVRYRDKSISDVLDMSVDQAIEFFSSQGEPSALRIAAKLKPLHDVGLGYVALGQNSSTLSGGESQRVKLAYFLGKEYDCKRTSSPTLFIFDEPTTGLHFEDISKLLQSFDSLIAKGHSIIVVEHNRYVIRAADHIIELGPEGGDEGGYLL
ncbi:MAG: excinuclease ABC subunit UvrA [Bacteroidales bacterium]|nr:excinuclease ABC subunit UvrA [Bacteroidales bacterium]